MAVHSSMESLEALSVSTARTECGICLEDAHRPKLLPCFHSFCVKCLQRHIDSNNGSGFFRCPLCRRRLEKPSNGAEGFEDNIYTESLPEEVCGEWMKCQACDESAAGQLCVDCQQIYCAGCAKLHLKMSPSKMHVLRAANKQDAKFKAVSKKSCEFHQNKKLNYYCLECKQAICGKCIIDKHKAHSCDEISEIAKTYRVDLNEMLLSQNYGYQFIALLEANVTEIKKGRSAFQNDVYNECLKIESHANRIKERIDRATKSLISEAMTREKEAVTRYNAASEDAEGKLKWARGTVQTVAQILELSSDTEFVAKYEEIRKELIELKSQISPTRIVQSEIKFMRNTPSSDEMVKSIGYIEVRGPIQFETLSKIEFPSQSLTPPRIQSICCLSGTDACVAFDNCVQISDKYGQKEQTLDLQEPVFALAMENNRGVLFCASKTTVFAIKQRQNLEKLFTLSDAPSGLAVTKECQFGICFEKAGSAGVYSREGNRLLELNKQHTRRPSAISSHGLKLYILDLGGPEIAVFDEAGQVLQVMQFSDIGLAAMCVHPKGRVVVGDTNGSVHLVAANGSYVQTLVSPRQKGHTAVTSLTFDPSGDLWIGDSAGMVHVLYECK